MAEFIHLLQSTGSTTLEAFWFPLLLWTCLSLLILVLIRYSRGAHAIFQYHGRMALLYGLPVGLGLSLLTTRLLKAWAGSEASAKFIVIQNPITITADMTQQIDWGNPVLWVGMATLLALAGAVIYVIKVIIDFIMLNRFAASLHPAPLAESELASESNRSMARRSSRKISMAVSPETEIPFTFGWMNPVIVFPCDLKEDDRKFNMALRHELMHIKNHDYMLNNLCVLVKAIFWFHPLVHRLYKDIEEFREISCDTEVLADNTISQKKYAELLYELAPRKIPDMRGSGRSVSMAVHPSSLKKRILIMKSQHFSNHLFRSSLILALTAMLCVAGILACSDLQDTGITNKDVEQAQSNIRIKGSGPQPLYVVNGDIMDSEKEKDILSRIKPMYIYSVNVLKGEKATKAYGEAGKQGVVEMTLRNKEKAFADLLDKAPSVKDISKPGKDYFVVVEDMPKLKGGLANLQKNITYPETARKAGIEGRVIIQFIVNAQGNVEDPHIIRGIGGGCDEEALKAVKQAKFEPGRQRGKAVDVQYALPIVFKLPDQEKKDAQSMSYDNEKTKSYSLPAEGSGVITETGPQPTLGQLTVKGEDMRLVNLAVDENGTLSGQVLDDKSGEPLPGTNVIIKDTHTGTTTDADGRFTLNEVNLQEIQLQLSYIGYNSLLTTLRIK